MPRLFRRLLLVSLVLGILGGGTTFAIACGGQPSGGGSASDGVYGWKKHAPDVWSRQVACTSKTTVTFGGYIFDYGLPTTYHFQYGKTTAYGSNTSTISIVGDDGLRSISATIATLTRSTTYHYRLVGTNAYGTDTGDDYTFKTAS